MNSLLALVFLFFGGWSLVSLIRRLRRLNLGIGVWLAFASLALVGIAVGIWAAFFAEYSVGALYRFGGFPIPIVVFHLEQGKWVDFPIGVISGLWVAVANIVFIVRNNDGATLVEISS